MIAARSEAQSGEPMKALWGEPNSSVFNLKEYCDKMIANREAYTTKRNNLNGSWKDSIELMKALWADPNSVFNSKEYRDKMIANCEACNTKINNPNGSWKDCSQLMKDHRGKK